MSFYHPDNLRAVTAGQWLRNPRGLPAIHGVGIDSREQLAGKLFIAIKGPNHDGHDYLPQAVAAGAALLLTHKDVPLQSLPDNIGMLRVEDTRRSLLKLAEKYRETLSSTKVIAVTGSAGKTTTRRLIHQVLSRAMRGCEAPKSFNNEIGVPLTLLQASPLDRYVVVEIGTNGPGQISPLAAITRPDIAVITMVGRSHLEGLGSVEGVAREKAALLFHLQEQGLAIVNADSHSLREHLRAIRSRVLFGRAEDAHLRLTARGRTEGGWWFEVNGRARFRLSLPGEHNAINALAVIAVARRMGLSDEAIDEGLSLAQTEPMRMMRLQVGEITIYNDAYNANPDSVLASLATFVESTGESRRRLIVLGDMLELGPAAAGLHREIGRKIVELDQQQPIAQVVVIGAFANETAYALTAAWDTARFTVFPQLTPASSAHVAGLLQAGDAVLLKGSRGAALERLIEAIQQRYARPVVEKNPPAGSCPPPPPSIKGAANVLI